MRPLTAEERDEIESIRADMHHLIDALFTLMFQVADDGVDGFLPMARNAHVLKGKKPASLRLPDGGQFEVKTWLEAAEIIVRDCNSDEERHQRLLEMTGKVLGRNRRILSDAPCGLDTPIKVDEGIYFEGKFDTQSLIEVLCNRILQPTGYGYNKVMVKVREEKND